MPPWPAAAPRPTLIQQVIEVLVVAEDDMAAHVEQEALGGDIGAGQAARLLRLQHSEEGGSLGLAACSDRQGFQAPLPAAPAQNCGTRHSDHTPPDVVTVGGQPYLVHQEPAGVPQLRKPRCGAKASRACSHHQHSNLQASRGPASSTTCAPPLLALANTESQAQRPSCIPFQSRCWQPFCDRRTRGISSS